VSNPEAEETLGQVREQSIDHILSVFSDAQASPAMLRQVALAAFMHGAWAGRRFDSLKILDLRDADEAELLQRIRARQPKEDGRP
jgi:hypothetical protein